MNLQVKTGFFMRANNNWIERIWIFQRVLCTCLETLKFQNIPMEEEKKLQYQYSDFSGVTHSRLYCICVCSCMLGLFLVFFGQSTSLLNKRAEAAVKRSQLLLFCLSCPPPLLRLRCCRPAAVCGCECRPWMWAEAPCPESCVSVGRPAAAELAVNRGGRENGVSRAGCIKKIPK